MDATLYHYCLWDESEDALAVFDDDAIQILIRPHPDHHYLPSEMEILPALFQVVLEALEAFPDALAAARAAIEKLRTELRGWALANPAPLTSRT